MAIEWRKYKPLLRYHRIFALCIVFTYIVIKYIGRTDSDSYENGQIKHEGRRENGFNEGRWIWYYPNGKKQMEGYFKHGKRNGKWVMYSKKEIIINERNYDTDKLNGPFVDYHSSGTKKCEGVFVNDRLNGYVKEYDENGNVLKEVYYENGIKKINYDNN